MEHQPKTSEGPWILALDNIFVDVARELEDNRFLEEQNVVPGTQNTATTPEMKATAKKVLDMKDGEYGSTKMAETAGGCAVNTARAAHFYF